MHRVRVQEGSFMEILKGKTSFPGIAAGKILFYAREEYEIRWHSVKDARKELDSFEKAKRDVAVLLEKLLADAEGKPASVSKNYRAQLQVLMDESYSAAIRSMIENQSVSAGYAIQTTRDELIYTFQKLEAPVIRERIRHIREISFKLIRALGASSSRIILGEEPVILMAEELNPVEILEMEKDNILAVVTFHGSEISHSSIMTRTMDIPSLFNINVRPEFDGRMAVVDGYTGTLYLDPSDEQLKEYELRRQEDLREREELMKLKDKPDVTLDGKEVNVYANIGSVDDLSNVDYYGADGVGLMRSEFQYLGKDRSPRENELFLEYKRLAEAMGGRTAIVRTMDLGADKKADYMRIPAETNPIMGNRGIRLALDHKDVFVEQLRAIYRAGYYGNLSVMFPMISSLEELDEIDQMILEVKENLAERKLPFRDIRRGVMIETPAAVMIAEELAARADFLSIGTNDLTQYTLAMDRQNPSLKDKYNDHHPAVLKMIKMVIDAGHRAGCRVFICGEIAAETSLTDTFLRMGVDALSVVPACVLPVRKILRQTDLSSVTEM